MKHKQTRFYAFMAMFLAVEVVLTFTPLGFLRIGPLSATTMHIPVIIAGIVFGIKGGIFTGSVFGFLSIVNATMNPGVTSFVFSPFIEIGGVHGNFTSILIAMVPRILLGIAAAGIYHFLKQKNISNNICILSAAIGATLTNTILVLCGIYLFFGESYAAAIHIDFQTLITVLLGVITTNGIFEVFLACILSVSICRALKSYIK